LKEDNTPEVGVRRKTKKKIAMKKQGIRVLLSFT